MTSLDNPLEQEILHIYQEPVIGSGYGNTYGEENLVRLVEKYRSLDEAGMIFMSGIVENFSTSTDLSASYISVGVLHALGKSEQVEAAYAWANMQDDSASISSHFDIGKSLAEYFIS